MLGGLPMVHAEDGYTHTANNLSWELFLGSMAHLPRFAALAILVDVCVDAPPLAEKVVPHEVEATSQRPSNIRSVARLYSCRNCVHEWATVRGGGMDLWE